MKKIFAIAAVAAAIFAMTSCGGSNGSVEESKTKSIKATTTRFEYGDLAKYIEVANEDATLSWSESNSGYTPEQTFKLDVELKLRKKIDAIADVDPYDIGLVSLLSGASIDLVDSNGGEIVDVDITSGDAVAFKEFLKGNAGDVKVITFVGKFHNSEKAPSWFKEAVSFKPGGTCSLQIKDGYDYYTPAL